LHSEKVEPRVLGTLRWNAHVSQSPAGGLPEGVGDVADEGMGAA
jgi:hypothetical protein